MKNKKAICPLCNELLKHHPTRMTHLWTCPACPFVGFEFYDEENLKDLKSYLKN